MQHFFAGKNKQLKKHLSSTPGGWIWAAHGQEGGEQGKGGAVVDGGGGGEVHHGVVWPARANRCLGAGRFGLVWFEGFLVVFRGLILVVEGDYGMFLREGPPPSRKRSCIVQQSIRTIHQSVNHLIFLHEL